MNVGSVTKKTQEITRVFLLKELSTFRRSMVLLRQSLKDLKSLGMDTGVLAGADSGRPITYTKYLFILYACPWMDMRIVIYTYTSFS